MGVMASTHLWWIPLVSNMCKLPRRGTVGGPGGRPGSLDPILLNRYTTHETPMINPEVTKGDGMIVIVNSSNMLF